MKSNLLAHRTLIVILIALLAGGGAVVYAQSSGGVLQPDEYDLVPGEQYIFNVPDGGDPAPTATSEPDPPTATPEPPDPTPEPGDGPTSFWHEPGYSGYLGEEIHGHEHGDDVPAWAHEYSIDRFGHAVGFGGDEATPGEDAEKHPGFKGYHTFFNGGEQYFRMHMMTTPLGESGIFHSMEAYMLDPAGNVTFLQGWVDFADGDSLNGDTVNHLQTNCGVGFNPRHPEGRPQMEVNTFQCYNDFGVYQFTDWYSDFHDILPETGINSKDTYFHDGEPSDPSTWTRAPDGNLGLTRRFEATWRHPMPGQGGVFYATQFGEVVAGPDDPVCGTAQTRHGQEHTVLCLYQEIASTAIDIGFPGNSVQKTYPAGGIVELPN